MKIIHLADVHLGSKIDAKFTKEKSEERRRDILATFKNVVEYAKENNIKVILLAGDVFDKDNPSMKDKKNFYSMVKNNPDIDFLYLKGNHDSETSYFETIPNLKEFSNKWSKYSYEDIDISGIEFDDGNYESLYSTLDLDESHVNIVMLHGQIASKVSKYGINLSKLKNKNIDYLALGHVHKYWEGAIDKRGIAVYPGCLEPRGFDELGEKGFVELEIEGKEIKHKFIPFASKTIHEIDVDISESKDAYSVYLKIKPLITNSNDMYRINLTGEKSFEEEGLISQLESYLSNDCYLVSIKDQSALKIDVSQYINSASLKGEFVRMVMNSSHSEEEKNEIIRLGLKALLGEDVA